MKRVFIATVVLALAGGTSDAAPSAEETYDQLWEDCCTPAIVQRLERGPAFGLTRLKIHHEGGEVIMATFTKGGSDPFGIEVGDELLSINGKVLVGLPYHEALSLYKWERRKTYSLQVKKWNSNAIITVSLICMKPGSVDLNLLNTKVQELRRQRALVRAASAPRTPSTGATR